MKRRVVITGMGIASPLGSTLESAYERLKTYENCVEHWPKLDEYERLNTSLGAFVSGFKTPEHFTRKVTRTMGKVSIMAVATAEDALKQAGLFGNEIISEAGVSYGSSTGSLDAVLDFYSMCIDKKVKLLNSGSYIKMMPQTAAVNISLYFKTHGRLIATSTACTSGSMGIGYAYEAIKDGYQDLMIAGGAEEIHPTQVGVFDTLYATSSKNSTPKLTPSPFDKDRDGLVIGEGAGTVILEEYERARARGAKIYAEIAGFAASVDYTNIQMSDGDALFFANLVKNTDMSNQSIAGEFQKALDAGNIQQVQSTAKASAALIAALQESAKTNQPFRIDFDKDVSVIIKVDKEGKINANFIPGDKAVENYLRNNIEFLKNRFNEENIAYGDVNYSKSRQNKEEQKKQNNKENEHE